MKIDEFQAEAADGRVFTLVAYQDSMDASSFEDPNGVIPGWKTMETDDGMSVNVEGDGAYRIVPLNLVVRRV